MTQPTLWLCDRTGAPVPVIDCLACATARRRPQCHFTPGLLLALARSLENDPALEAISRLGIPVVRVTGLTGCSRQTWFARRRDQPLEKPSRLWARLRGVIFHEALREGNGVSERRLVHLLALEGGQNAIVTGRVDNYAHAVLTDYKTVDNGGRRLDAIALPMSHHTLQLEVYAWLIARALGERVQEARLVYITMGGIRTVDVPVPDETRLARIEEEVGQKVKTVINPQLPAANPSEAWECRYCAHKRACRDAKTR